MSRKSTTLRRFGAGSLGACMLLATPYLGAVANAAAPAPGTAATVTIASQTGNTGSTLNDGTNATVKISATTTPNGSGQAAVAGVRFSYQAATGGPVVIGTDTTAPYAAEWAPPAAGTYTEIAEALDAANTVINSSSKPGVVVAATTSSVHISSPADGAMVGAFGGNIVVSGTRSSDLPALSISAQTRDNSSGTLTAAGAPTAVAVGTPAPGADQAWSATVAAPACVNSVTAGDCDVVITAVASGTSASDEVVQAKLYTQTLTTFTVAPATATKPVGVAQNYVVTATDQNTKPIAGLTVDVTASGSATALPANGTTGPAGTFTFAGNNTVAETATFTVQSWINGASYVVGTDFSRTATLTSYASTPTTLAISATPVKALYAAPSEYDGTTPIVDVCVIDQNSQGTPNAAVPPANLITTITRTTTSGTTVTGPTTSTVVPVQDTRTGKGNCYVIQQSAAAGDFGQDVFNAYYENNGTPGYQAGSSDVAATAVTLKFATLDITTPSNTQAQQGTNANIAFTVKGLDGTPFGNRKVALSLSGVDASFPTTQPAGTTFTGPGAATCVTDANGVCNVTVTDPTAGTDTVTATDSITDATLNQIATGDSASSFIEFRALPVTLTEVDPNNYAYVTRAAGGNDYAYNSYPYDPKPGDAVSADYYLYDANGDALRGVSATFTLDHGFFTPDCSNVNDYKTCTFAPAIADGAMVGNLLNEGSTKTFTSNSSGLVHVTFAIGRDAGFDDDGRVNYSFTVVANGGSYVSGPANSSSYFLRNEFSTDYSYYGPGSYNSAYNGASLEVLPYSATDKLSGDVNDTRFIVHAKDQFGNLVEDCSIAVAVTGTAAQLDDSSMCSSYTNNVNSNELHTTNTTTTAGSPATVTATWTAPVTTFKAVTPATTPATYTVNTATSPKTASFTVNVYKVDNMNLAYTFASTPGNSVPVNTAVTTSVTVKDQKGNPVQGQSVQFIRSGPGSQSGGDSGYTNAAGKTGFSFSSTETGVATITVIVKDGNGNELSRGVQNVTFTSAASALSVSLTTGAINPGKPASVIITGTPGDVVNLFAQTAPATSFTQVRTGLVIGSGGTVEVPITPRRNTQLYASNGSASNVVTLFVRPAIALTGTTVGKTASFTGSIVPGVSGSRVRLFSVSNGVLKLQAETFTTADGKFSFPAKAYAVTAGQSAQFLAQTTTNANNLSGQSPRTTVTFG